MSQVRDSGRGLRVVVLIAVATMFATLLSVVTPSPVGAIVDPTVTVVIGTASRPSRPDQAILDRLDATGHPYVVVDDSELTAQMADDADFVLLTDSVLRGRVRGDIEATSTPVASMKWGLFRDLGFLERGGRAGRVGGGKSITINDPSHPLAAGLSGDVEVLTRNVAIGYANIGSEGTMVAERGMARRMRSTIFAFEEGETLSSGAIAPGRRIGTFISNAVVTRLNSNGWALFDAMIDYGIDGAVVNPNTPPVVTITAPSDGDSFVAGDLVSFAGSAIDPEDGDISVDLEWVSSIDGSLNTGASFSTTGLSVGTHVITAEVGDSGGATGSDSITITVNPVPNTPPVVTITAPNDGDTFTVGDEVTFTGTANDAEDGDLTAFIDWESNIDGLLATTTGSFSTASLSVGIHMITASVVDTSGDVGADGIQITIVANAAPVVTIASPADGATFTEGFPVLFAGSATDAEDGDLSSQLDWSSDLDGSLGTDDDSFTTSGLSIGTHVITASVTDSGGVMGDASITVTIAVNAAPVVTITSPSDGDTFLDSDTVPFSGTANDAEDGDISSQIDWSSDLDGSLATNTASFTGSELSLGTHTITASVTDSQGETSTDTIQITIAVNTPPVVTITNPTFGDSFTVGDSVLFAGTANDAEDGDISASLAWSSDIEGPLDTGATFSTSLLSVGTHVITASVTDSDGATNDESIQITITANAAPVVTITDPIDGVTFPESFGVPFAGSATDAEDGDISGQLDWSSDLDGPLETDVDSFITASLSVGTHVITASVTDSGGAMGDDSITVIIAPNTPPVVTITDPNDGDSFTLGESVSFSGTAIDAENGDLTSNLAWASDIDGDLAFNTGSFSTSSLSLGTHTITAMVPDSLNVVGTDSIQITIVANAPPVVTITQPTDGDSFTSGNIVSFTATATDAEDGDISGQLDWESDLDGSLATDTDSFSTASLSVGTHVITASVTDSGGAMGDDSITVIVAANQPPVVTITAPNDGDSFTLGESVSFSGTAIDAEDGDLTPLIVWDSSIDGNLATFTGSFSTAGLSLGTHTITARAEDTNLAASADSIQITIAPTTAPVVTITAPNNLDSFTFGDSVSFAGTAIDAEDGDISASLTWLSSRDGPLPSGASFSINTLSIGTHVIFADVTDSSGATDTDSVMININAPNQAPVINDQGFNVAEESAAGTVIGTVAATDPDLDALTFSIDDDSEIDIDSSSGELTVVDLSARSVGDDITVTVTVTDPGGLTDDATITVSVGAVSIGLDVVVDGEINPSGDTDSYQFTASAGTTIFFDVLDEVDNNCDTQLVITITDPSDAQLSSITVFSCASDAGPFDLTETGDYLVEVAGFNGDTGAYQFEVVTVPTDVPTAVAYDTPTTGSVATRGATDSFTFVGAVGDVLFFDLLAEAPTNGSDAVYNWTATSPTGSVLFDLDIFGNGSDGGTHTLTEAGTYTIVFDDPGDDTFDFEFEIVTVPVDVPTAVAYDTPTTGAVTKPGETDSFTFVGAVGDELFFDLQSVAATNGSNGIFNWSATSPTGATLFNVTIFGTGSDGGTHTLTEAGTYTIVFDDPGDDTFDFEFEIVDQTAP